MNENISQNQCKKCGKALVGDERKKCKSCKDTEWHKLKTTAAPVGIALGLVLSTIPILKFFGIGSKK